MAHALPKRAPEVALDEHYPRMARYVRGMVRQQARHASARPEVDPEAVATPDPEPSAELQLEQEQMSTRVQAHVAGLSDSYRAACSSMTRRACPRARSLVCDPTPGGVSLGSGRSSHQ